MGRRNVGPACTDCPVAAVFNLPPAATAPTPAEAFSKRPSISSLLSENGRHAYDDFSSLCGHNFFISYRSEADTQAGAPHDTEPTSFEASLVTLKIVRVG